MAENELLASRLRPQNLDDFVGQEHLVGKTGPLRKAIEKKIAFSFILWGPAGTGKTTLARIYAQSLGMEYREFSAVSASKDDLKRFFHEHEGLFSKPLVIFLDEIHRFNKAQQDFLLPYIEKGAIILIGATTENPSFEVIPALLSRCRVFILNALSDKDMAKIIDRAGVDITDEAKDMIIQMVRGDARQALSVVENTANFYKKITLQTLEKSQQKGFLKFDKKGDEHYNTVSAFIKSMRASNPDAALYYLARMIEAGEDPLFIARRMVIFASEDIGVAHPWALVVANNVFRAVETIGLPEAQINLAHGVTYLALAKKDRSAYEAYFAALDDVKKYGSLEIPLKIRNAPTRLMKEAGYGKGYEKYNGKDFLPEKLKDRTYLKLKPKEQEK